MKIIVEGVDGTGKTTLAKKLAYDLNYYYVKSRVPEYKADLKLIGQFPSVQVVHDRWSPISEPIYGTALNRDPLLINYAEGLDMVLKLLSTTNALIIWCTNTNNYSPVGQMAGIRDNYSQLKKLYKKYLHSLDSRLVALKLDYKLITFDYEVNSYKVLLEVINERK